MTVKELISTLEAASPDMEVYFWMAIHSAANSQNIEQFAEKIYPISRIEINPICLCNGISYRQNCVFLE